MDWSQFVLFWEDCEGDCIAIAEEKDWLESKHAFLAWKEAVNERKPDTSPVAQMKLHFRQGTTPLIRNTWWLGANYDFTPAIKGSLGYYQQNANQNATTLAGRTTFISAMAEYYLSKRTNLYAAASQVNFTGSAVGAASYSNANVQPTVVNQQFTYGLGMRHTF